MFPALGFRILGGTGSGEGSKEPKTNTPGGSDFGGSTSSDSFHYHASDGSADSNIVTVTIKVNFVNTAPLAAEDSYTTLQNSSLKVSAQNGALTNDVDTDGDQLIAILKSSPSNGSLSLSPDGSFFYKPNADFFGLDSFSYLASDSKDSSGEVTVVIDVREDNQARVANQDTYDMLQSTTLIVDAPGVLANDSDPDGDLLSVILITAPQNGSLHLDADGGFTYRSDQGFSGQVTFEYEVLDGHGGRTPSNPIGPITTVTINVQARQEIAVPFLDAWGRMLLVLLLAGMAVFTLRQGRV